MQQNEAEVLDLFVRGLGHDIAAPFRTIEGAALLLAKDQSDDSIIPLIVDAAKVGSEQLDALIGAMRLFMSNAIRVPVSLKARFEASNFSKNACCHATISNDLVAELPEAIFELICEYLCCAIDGWADESEGVLSLARSLEMEGVELSANFVTGKLRPRAVDRFFVPVAQNYIESSAGKVPLGFLIKVAAIKLGGDASIFISEEGNARLVVQFPI